jgi:AcrR family transcriptional regulator
MRRTAADANITRHTILTVAREAFEQHGFSGSSLDAIAAAAGVTRGAVHHHFGNKEVLFREVFSELNRSVGATVQEAAKQSPTVWEGFSAGVLAVLNLMSDPGYVRIAGDAPAVLGFADFHTLNRETGLQQLGAALVQLNREGILSIAPHELPAVLTLLFGALNEGGLSLTRPDALAPETIRDAFLDLVLRYVSDQPVARA